MKDNFNIHEWHLNRAINENKSLQVDITDEDWSQSIAYKISDALIQAGYGRDMVKQIAKAILTRPSLQEGKQLCKECGAGYMEEGQCMECGYMEEGFPDLSGDGKITQKDILIGKGVIKKEGMDHEVSMAQNSLKSIISSASQLMNKLGDDERNIPGWIQDHITNAENYIDQAAQGFHELEPAVNDMDSDVLDTIAEGDEDELVSQIKGEMDKLISKIEDKVEDTSKTQKEEILTTAGLLLVLPALLRLISNFGRMVNKIFKKVVGEKPNDKKEVEQYFARMGKLADDLHALYMKPLESLISKLVKDPTKSKKVSHFIFHVIIAILFLSAGITAFKAIQSKNVSLATLETALASIKGGEIKNYIAKLLA